MIPSCTFRCQRNRQFARSAIPASTFHSTLPSSHLLFRVLVVLRKQLHCQQGSGRIVTDLVQDDLSWSERNLPSVHVFCRERIHRYSHHGLETAQHFVHGAFESQRRAFHRTCATYFVESLSHVGSIHEDVPLGLRRGVQRSDFGRFGDGSLVRSQAECVAHGEQCVCHRCEATKPRLCARDAMSNRGVCSTRIGVNFALNSIDGSSGGSQIDISREAIDVFPGCIASLLPPRDRWGPGGVDGGGRNAHERAGKPWKSCLSSHASNHTHPLTLQRREGFAVLRYVRRTSWFLHHGEETPQGLGVLGVWQPLRMDPKFSNELSGGGVGRRSSGFVARAARRDERRRRTAPGGNEPPLCAHVQLHWEPAARRAAGELQEGRGPWQTQNRERKLTDRFRRARAGEPGRGTSRKRTRSELRRS